MRHGMSEFNGTDTTLRNDMESRLVRVGFVLCNALVQV